MLNYRLYGDRHVWTADLTGKQFGQVKQIQSGREMTMVFVGLKSDFRGYWLRQISECKVSDARMFNSVVLFKTIRKCFG